MQNFCLGMVNGLSEMTLVFDITKGSEIETLSYTSRRYTTEIHKPSLNRQRDRAKIWNRAGFELKVYLWGMTWTNTRYISLPDVPHCCLKVFGYFLIPSYTFLPHILCWILDCIAGTKNLNTLNTCAVIEAIICRDFASLKDGVATSSLVRGGTIRSSK